MRAAPMTAGKFAQPPPRDQELHVIMRQSVLTVTAATLLFAGVAFAASRDRFGTTSLRGRYTGNLTLAEHIQVDTNTILNINGYVLMGLTFDGKSDVVGVASVSAAIPGNPPVSFNCVFDAQGTYEIAESGLGSATLNITPTSECAGPAVLKMGLLVGGKNRSRVDVTIQSASGLAPDSVPIAVVGGGMLSEQ